MELISAIVGALSAGAAALASGALSKAGKDAYNRLRGAILRIVSLADLERLEQNPKSDYCRVVLEEELARAGMTEDIELAELAWHMITALKEADAVYATGISLEDAMHIIQRTKRKYVVKRKYIIEDSDAARRVHFTVYHPKEIKPEVWCTLLAYVHILEMQSTVEADAKQRLEVPHGRRIGVATHGIARWAEILVAPELPGCRFNPPSAHLLWLEDWHRVEFRLQAHPDLAGFELGKAVNGRVAFYVESILVGEVPIWACISDEADTTAADAPTSTASAEPYEAIFVSYAQKTALS